MIQPGGSRPHGFLRQRMVVVPSPVWKRLGSHPLLKGLRVTDAGFFPKASGHLVSRQQGAETDILIACVEGTGNVRLGKERFSAQPGDFFWLPAHREHYYAATQESPWSILWVHFTGTDREGWHSLIFGDKPGPVCRIPPERIGELSLDRIHATLENGYSLLHLIEATTVLRYSLGVLSRLCHRPGSTLSARSRVASSVERLRSSSGHLHRLDELAAQAGVSVSHYASLFKKETGFSPIDFVLRQRIQQAAQLLATSQESIAAVALSVGYDDPYYFSRSFRKIMGCSPRTYRRSFAPTP